MTFWAVSMGPPAAVMSLSCSLRRNKAGWSSAIDPARTGESKVGHRPLPNLKADARVLGV